LGTILNHKPLGSRQTVLVSLAPTLVKTELTALPTPCSPAVAAKPTSAAINAYSTISWPLSSFRKKGRSNFNLLIPTLLIANALPIRNPFCIRAVN
jgi:hypothetical protein